jgi:hypothetical protein
VIPRDDGLGSLDVRTNKKEIIRDAHLVEIVVFRAEKGGGF